MNNPFLCLFIALLLPLQCANCWVTSKHDMKKISYSRLLQRLAASPEQCETSSSKSTVLQKKEWINGNVWIGEPDAFEVGKLFRNLVPVIGRGCDVTVKWSDPNKGARNLVDSLDLHGKDESDSFSFFSKSFEQFQNMVNEEGILVSSFKTRVVASRGPIGTKCPRWHFDYTPVRWIQSLVGPGCDYVISEVGVDRTVLNRSDSDETEQTNKDIVDSILADINHGQEGYAVILKGLEGCEKPAIHKSPELQWWQGRILMTLDIILEY